jgi:ribulose-phosphate 3-epimerase
MVEPVDALIHSFAQAGANCISIHPKTSPALEASIQLIHSLGCDAGLVLNPEEPIDLITSHLHHIERVLLMSVHPGFGGQTFIPQVLNKARSLRELIQQINPEIRLEIDGGINDQTIVLSMDAGVDTFVAGSYIFSSADVRPPLQKLRQALNF